jgi:hypothetical protein
VRIAAAVGDEATPARAVAPSGAASDPSPQRPAFGPARVVFERDLRFTPDPEHSSWLGEEAIDVSEFALAPIELCLAAHGLDGGPADSRFFWLAPSIRSDRSDAEESDAPAGSPEQQAQREKRLRALGYVD